MARDIWRGVAEDISAPRRTRRRRATTRPNQHPRGRAPRTGGIIGVLGRRSRAGRKRWPRRPSESLSSTFLSDRVSAPYIPCKYVSSPPNLEISFFSHHHASRINRSEHSTIKSRNGADFRFFVSSFPSYYYYHSDLFSKISLLVQISRFIHSLSYYPQWIHPRTSFPKR